MQVMCVRPIKNFIRGNDNAPRPAIGDIETVVKLHREYNRTFYILERFGKKIAYDKNYFAHLDGPCEIEIAEARIAADAAELDAQYYKLLEDNENE